MAPGRKRKPGKRYPCGKRTKQQLEMDAQRVGGVRLLPARFMVIEQSMGVPKGQVVFTGFVDEAELHALYRSASLFVFPSLYEGFGIPAVEAFSCGGTKLEPCAQRLLQGAQGGLCRRRSGQNGLD